MLTYLIADLARDANLRKRFDNDPTGVLDEYNISDEHRGVLQSRDTGQLESLLQGETNTLVGKLSPTARFFWPGNQLQLTSISPTNAPVETQVDFTAKGEMFDTDATLTFNRPGAEVQATNVRVTNEGLDSKMTANVTFSEAGSYDVTVTNPGSGQKSTLPQAFTAE